METKTSFPTVRLIVSIVVVVMFGAVGYMWKQALSMMQGIVAARQINDDSVAGNALAFWFRNSDIVGFVIVVSFFLILGWIWRCELKVLFLTSLVVLALMGCAPRATTESEKTSIADVVDIKPNQTVFVIPTIAGSKEEQARFESIDYLESKKVASKRVILDKDNVGGKYLPKTYVILVDRTPVARQWTKESTTGTNASNEALCGESSESIEVCFQISMAAAVEETNTATYLYYFPTTKLQDAQVNGVYKATDLDQIVDNQVRQYLTQKIGDSCATRTLRDIIKDKAEIVRGAETAAKKYFKDQGITLAYVGLGGQLMIDQEIQTVINRLFVAEQEREIAKAQATRTIIDAEAAKRALELKGEGDAKALAELKKALGDMDLGSAITAYRWNGSYISVILSSETKPSVALPLPTAVVPAAQPTGTAVPKK